MFLLPRSRPAPAPVAASPVAAAPLVAGHGLGVHRRGRWLIRDVDITVRRGEIVSVIGPNGAGKTTLIRALLGLEAADVGTVQRVPGLRLGYVPQKLAIDPVLPLSVRHLMRLTRPVPEAAVRDLLARLGVADRLHAQVGTLSGGEFQRVLLARALLSEPDLLVLDEPAKALDLNGEIDLYEHIRRIRDGRGCGILLVSHDLHVVMGQTDQVVCLNGHVCCSGTPATVASSAAFKHLFGPRAAGVLAPYVHNHDHAHDLHGDVVDPDGGRTLAGGGGSHA